MAKPAVDHNITGEIKCDGVTYSRPFYHSIRKRMERWIGGHIANSRTYYRASFHRNWGGHLVLCQLSVTTAAGVAIASSYGHGAQQALDQCLKVLNVSHQQPPAPQEVPLSKSLPA